MGKTRLAYELVRRIGRDSHFLSLSSGNLGGYELASSLRGLPSDTALIVFDDVDEVSVDQPAFVNDLLLNLPTATVVMTAAVEKLHPSWEPIAGAGSGTVARPLRGLSPSEARALLAAVGAADSQSETAIGTAMGNPRLILEWAALRHGEGVGTSIATILGPDGVPIAPGDAGMHEVEVTAKGVSDALIRELARNPELMYDLSPRRFEELVAELYARSGFEVELTQASKDGGVDIYAFQKAPFGSFLTIVDCKRYRADRPVQVGLIRQLHGTVIATDASVGVIATTSFFTTGAKQYQAERRHRLALQDFVSLKEMLPRSPDGGKQDAKSSVE